MSKWAHCCMMAASQIAARLRTRYPVCQRAPMLAATAGQFWASAGVPPEGLPLTEGQGLALTPAAFHITWLGVVHG